jgi:hypothetical protein
MKYQVVRYEGDPELFAEVVLILADLEAAYAYRDLRTTLSLADGHTLTEQRFGIALPL